MRGVIRSRPSRTHPPYASRSFDFLFQKEKKNIRGQAKRSHVTSRRSSCLICAEGNTGKIAVRSMGQLAAETCRRLLNSPWGVLEEHPLGQISCTDPAAGALVSMPAKNYI